MIYNLKVYTLFITAIFACSFISVVHAVGPGESLGGAPQTLKSFNDECYGTGSQFQTILIPENKNDIGYIYLIDNPKYSYDATLSPYNIVLCSENKLRAKTAEELVSSVYVDTSSISEKTGIRYYSLYHYFKDEAGNKALINFLLEDYDGLFIFTNSENNWKLSLSKTDIYVRDEVRYSLLGFSVIENVVLGKDTRSLSMVQSLEFAIQEIVRNKVAQWSSSLPVSYPKTCNLRSPSGGSSYCPPLVKVPLVKGATFSSTVKAIDTDPYVYTSEEEGDKKYKKRELVYYFFLLKEEYDSFDKITVLVEKEKSDGPLFDDLFEFNNETHQLQQKDGVELTIEDSPYIIKVSVRENAVNIDELSQLTQVIVASNLNSNTLIAELAEDEGSTNEYNLYISVVEPSTYEASPSTPQPNPVSVISSGGGGKDELVVRRLRGETIAPTPTSSPKVLVCPTKKYNRYPEKRGEGVDSQLFTDAFPSHRAYKGLIDLGEQEIVNGDKETGDARLDDTISRAEFVKIMTIAREDTLLLGDCLKLSNFYDVPSDAWYTPFIQNLEQKAIVKGYTDNNYRPGKSINVVEAYKIIALSFDYISLEQAHKIVNDQNIQWYIPYVQALEKGGVIPEWMRSYEMNSEISRGDMFALLANVLRQKDWMKDINWN